MLSRHHHRLEWLVTAAVLVAVVCGPRPATAARWYEDYQQAADAIDSGVCSPEAIELLGAALTDKPKPRLNARTIAQRRVDYLPYYQLARAHLNCRNFDLARKYLADSRERETAPEDALDLLQARLGRLEEQAARPTEPAIDPSEVAERIDRAREQLGHAAAAARSLDQLLTDPLAGEVFAADPGWAGRRNAADASLEQARGRLREGVDASDPIVLADAAVLAAGAATQLTGLERDLRAERDSLARQRERARQARMAPTPTPTRPPQPTATPRPRATAEPAPPKPLRRAATLYLAGDYRAAVEVLSEGLPGEGRERAVALLLRSASRWSLARLEPDAAAGLEAASRQDAVACRAADAALEPDPRWFSPAFAEFFDSVTDDG